VLAQDSVSLAHTGFLHGAVQNTDHSLLLDQGLQKRGGERGDTTEDGRSGGAGRKARVVVHNSLREGWVGGGGGVKEVRIAGCNGHNRGLVRSLSKEGNQKVLCHILGNHRVGLLVSGKEEEEEVHTILLVGSVVGRRIRTTSVKGPQKMTEDHESSGTGEDLKEDNEKRTTKVEGHDSCNNHRFHLFRLCDEGLKESLRGQGVMPKGCCTLRGDGCCSHLRCGDEKKKKKRKED
jgi:hypothetical protein